MTRNANRPIATLAAKEAIDNIGVQEVGNNGGKAVETYLASCIPSLGAGAPWCAAFVRYRMKAAATKLGLTYDISFPRSGYTPDWANWAKQNNKWIAANQILNGLSGQQQVKDIILPGDLALFYFSQLGRIGHIGIVVNANANGLTTIEGNTSPEPADAHEVEREGDGVYRRRRTWRSLGKFGGILMVDF